MQLQLSEAGHSVVHAVNGADAIREFSSHKSQGIPFDLVILDLTIQGGNGAKDVIVRLKEIDPGVLAILSTGYQEDPVVKDYRDHGFLCVLHKPFDKVELTMAVDRALWGN